MHVYVCDIITDHRFVLLFRDSSFLTVFPLISISQLCNRSKISPKNKFSRQSFLEFLPLCIHCQFYACDQQCLLCRSQEHSNAFLRASLQLFFFYCYFQHFQNLQNCRCKRYICLEVSPLVCLCSLSVFTTSSSHTELCCLKLFSYKNKRVIDWLGT